jgi:hydrogenase nickel incorporation protein HypA/HybF
MHELAVCRSLLSEVERVASAHGATVVTGLSVVVGPLSGVEAPLLSRAFAVARIGTMAEAAELRFESSPVVVWCAACEIESVVKPNALSCQNCGGWRVSVKSGDELLLKRVELADPAFPAAPANGQKGKGASGV